MTVLVPGDPASISALAGDLARTAERLRERASTLQRAHDEVQRWSGTAAEGFRAAFRTQLRAVDDTADALATCAHALQEYTVDLQHARALGVEAEDFCHRHGLELSDDGTVRMPWGPYSVHDANVYADHLPEAQRLARRAREGAEDAAVRLSRRVDGPAATLGTAAAAVLSAVQLAAGAASASR